MRRVLFQETRLRRNALFSEIVFIPPQVLRLIPSLAAKLQENYSKSYKRDLKSVTTKFLEFLTPSEKRSTEDKLSTDRIQGFLNTFNTTKMSYMNKRQTLMLLKGIIQKTPRKKSPEKPHEIYQKK